MVLTFFNILLLLFSFGILLYYKSTKYLFFLLKGIIMKNNKSNKIIKNLLFVFLVILVIIGICFFNYKMDPYRLFANKFYMRLNEYPREMIYTVMKSYKDIKNDNLILGSSETIALFNDKFINYFNNVSAEGINFKQYKELLDVYLKFHPETKKVIIVVSLINVVNNIELAIPEFDGVNYSIKEYKNIFFSLDATIKSFNIIKSYINYLINKYLYKKEIIYYLEFYPKQSFDYLLSKEDLNNLENKNFKDIRNLIEYIKTRNLDYVIIIPPYNSIFLSMINNQKYSQEKIDNFKRFLVKIVPDDKKIYDFAFVNKYTSSNINENYDALYCNITHPSFIYGIKINKIIFDDKNADHSLYLILNKKNIESVLKKENKLLENYMKNNSKLIKYYEELAKNQNDENFNFHKKINLKLLPEDSKNELEYISSN